MLNPKSTICMNPKPTICWIRIQSGSGPIPVAFISVLWIGIVRCIRTRSINILDSLLKFSRKKFKKLQSGCWPACRNIFIHVQTIKLYSGQANIPYSTLSGTHKIFLYINSVCWCRSTFSKFKRNFRIGEQRQWRGCCQWLHSIDIAIGRPRSLNCGGRLGQFATTNQRGWRLRFRRRTQFRGMIRFRQLRWAAQMPQLYRDVRLGDVRLCAGRHEADRSRLRLPMSKVNKFTSAFNKYRQYAAFVLLNHALNRQLMVLFPLISLACCW